MGDGWVGEWVTRHRKCIRSHQPMSATLRTPVYTRDCCFFVREMTATPRRSCRDAALAWRPGHPRGAGACAREQLETAHTTMHLSDALRPKATSWRPHSVGSQWHCALQVTCGKQLHVGCTHVHAHAHACSEHPLTNRLNDLVPHPRVLLAVRHQPLANGLGNLLGKHISAEEEEGVSSLHRRYACARHTGGGHSQQRRSLRCMQAGRRRARSPTTWHAVHEV
jgi:hypothetical protein